MESELGQINDRYNKLNKSLNNLREVCNVVLQEMGPDVMYINQIMAEVESAQTMKAKLLAENRTIQNDNELKKQEGEKVVKTYREKAQEYLDAAISDRVKATQLLDSVKTLEHDADIRSRKNKLAEALG